MSDNEWKWRIERIRSDVEDAKYSEHQQSIIIDLSEEGKETDQSGCKIISQPNCFIEVGGTQDSEENRRD